MPEQLSALALAERVAATALGLGIETAIIGALALAAHNYVRATEDIDLATCVDPFGPLRELERQLRDEGFSVLLRMPDEEDPLGGVLVVWQREDDDGDPIDPVEVVNFYNPHRPRRNPARSAIQRAVVLDGALRYVALPDLIALKLDAGGPKDLLDILELLFQNPDADLEEIRAVAAPFGAAKLEELIESNRVRSSVRGPASS